jgi:uncharacterized protein YgiM (DUF1202 family)
LGILLLGIVIGFPLALFLNKRGWKAWLAYPVGCLAGWVLSTIIISSVVVVALIGPGIQESPEPTRRPGTPIPVPTKRPTRTDLEPRATSTTEYGVGFGASEYVYVSVSSLAVRSGAGVDYDTIGYLYECDKVLVTDKFGQWWEVWADNQKGFINKDYVSEEECDN